MRNSVKKMIPRTSCWRSFWYQNRPKNEKKWFLYRKENHNNFQQIFLRFMLHFGAHGAPKNSSFFIQFCSAFTVSWRQEVAQSAPRQYQTPIFHEFGTILDNLFLDFSTHFTLFVTLFLTFHRYHDTPIRQTTPIHRYTDIPIIHR